MLRIAIFDGQGSVRDGLRTALRRRAGYEIAGEAGTEQEALEICAKVRLDLVVLDLELPGSNGVELLTLLLRKMRGLKVVIFADCLEEQIAAQAIALGASALVSKNEPICQLLGAIDVVAAGGTFFDPRVAHLTGRAPTNMDWQTLTGRERQVIVLIALGKSTKEAASCLGISAKTLDKHRSNMMKKLRLHDAVAVTRYAIQAGLVALS